MEENKHTKEEILELLECKLKKVDYCYEYELIDDILGNWVIKFEIRSGYSNIVEINNGCCIYKDNMKLLLELMDILEEEEEKRI